MPPPRRDDTGAGAGRQDRKGAKDGAVSERGVLEGEYRMLPCAPVRITIVSSRQTERSDVSTSPEVKIQEPREARPTLNGAEFTTQKIEVIKRESAGVPVIVDDLVQKRFTDYAVEAIKHDDFGLYEDLPNFPAVVISANEDVKAVDKQVTRRMVTCHVQAGLMSRECLRGSLVTVIQNKITTAFYRRYLKLMFERVPVLIEQFASDKYDFLPDILALSSEVLYDLLSAYIPIDRYPYLRKLTVDTYFDEKVAGAGVIERFQTDWRMRPKLFRVDRRKQRLIYDAEATYEADRLLKQLPEMLLASKSGSSVSMDYKEACAFFHLDARGILGRLPQVLKRRGT